MTTTTQHISSNPALDFANAILEESNNGLELIEILHDIAVGNDEKATGNDRIAANNILLDRGLGKCPKQSPATIGANPDPAPETHDNDVAALREAPSPESAEGEGGACPERSRRVTQIDHALNQSLGPAPDAHPQQPVEPALSLSKGAGLVPAQPNLDPFSIQTTIQQHILAITDNCRTLHDALFEIARACPEPVEGAKDDPKACPEQRRRIKTSHRWRATRILLDRGAGTDLMPAHSAICPECRRKWSTHDGSHTHTETHPKKTPGRRMSKVDPEALAKVHAKLKQMEDEGILTPDPNAEEIDITPYLPPQDFDLSPYAKEEAAKFWANIELRYERQKAWPAIEERRRKKLAQIYPSHTDSKSPDT